ncbi:MAG TPA: hypothetical protein VK465_09575 [Fibrobacteria bacterium]|nr:hypothetical protein [Fibrobacteria bacterium]
MKNSSNIQSAKSKTLGMLLAAMVPTGAALAEGGYHRHDCGVEIGGEVVVTKQIPGGVVTVGATIGRPRPVVVEEKVVVKERAPEKVVIVEREPVREKVVIVKERPAREKVIIVEQHGWRHRHTKNIIVHEDRGCRGRDHYDDDARQVSIQSRDGRGNSHYYRDENQVSESYSGPEGNYHYYEDQNQVSIEDNRYGQNKHVYVRK